MFLLTDLSALAVITFAIAMERIAEGASLKARLTHGSSIGCFQSGVPVSPDRAKRKRSCNTGAVQ
jgi:hypothetical protein